MKAHRGNILVALRFL